MMSFAQTDVECYCCHDKGHITTNCPKLLAKKAEKKSEKQLTQFEATAEKWNKTLKDQKGFKFATAIKITVTNLTEVCQTISRRIELNNQKNEVEYDNDDMRNE